jgi:hypothetical protein
MNPNLIFNNAENQVLENDRRMPGLELCEILLADGVQDEHKSLVGSDLNGH